MKSNGIQAFLDDNESAITEALYGGKGVARISKSPSQYQVDALLANNQGAIAAVLDEEQDHDQHGVEAAGQVEEEGKEES